MAKSNNWTTVAESKFPWERDALDFVRSRFPGHDPYRAWANFEFIADDGSINEVDLLVFTPQGFFLVEIKSRVGRLFGDAGTWTWESDGSLLTVDNPLIAANLKAKKLRSVLQQQKAARSKGQIPFVEPLVFCSAPELKLELQGNARYRICLRDRPAEGDRPARPGIMAALINRTCPGLESFAKGTHDRPMAKVVSQAMDQAGIRPSQRVRRVADYVLEQLIDQGPGYQDWQASHTQVPGSKRRVRLYLVRHEATAEDRATIQRAAMREFQILESLEHPGILRAYNLIEHELGPALLLEHDPQSIRLDHYLAQQQGKLTVDTQLDLVRQIAEVVHYAHEKKVIHRALCPQSILVTNLADGPPRIKLLNWQVGYRRGSSSTGASRMVTATSHIDRLVEDAATVYMAPESLTESSTGEHLDVFSLGAIAYHIFSGVPPAANAVELSDKLRETKGLQLSSIMNGAAESLQDLIRFATHPVVPDRLETVNDFLGMLDEVENELTVPDRDYVDDAARAQQGDLLPGDLRVVRRLGQGACSVALLVERGGQSFVLKVASDTDHNQRVKDEGELLGKREMRHPGIVDVVETGEYGGYCGFLMRPVFADKERGVIETLGQRLRKEGRLHMELLQRFGEDLLAVVNHLEEQGVPHRDIKPDNIAVGMVGRGDKLHLVLFDFSLSRTPADNIRAGTTGYLDPLLPLRRPPRWDLHAERYSAAVTLYELATGTVPKWGDGSTDPSHLNPDTEITIDPELFDPALREQLTGFFRRAFKRDIAKRFDNAEEMLRSWRQCFEGLDESLGILDESDESTLAELLADATFDTPIADLGLGPRATHALDRHNVLTVEDLLTFSQRSLMGLRGVGTQTRREISAAARILRDRLGTPETDLATAAGGAETSTATTDIGTLGLDLLISRLMKTVASDGDLMRRAVHLLLGFEPSRPGYWASQAEIAEQLGENRMTVVEMVSKLQRRWAKDGALERVRHDIAEMLSVQGGAMSDRELAEALLVARGSSEDEPLRSQLARGLLRAATEAERVMPEPRFLVRRHDSSVLVAISGEVASYALRLGAEADSMADEDPLLAPARVIERLRDVAAPDGVAIADTRLLRLAAEASQHAAVSSRQELYPVGMAAVRALKLAQGALLGQRTLDVAQIRDRVMGRYPQAQPLPDRTELDDLLKAAGFNWTWDSTARNGAGCFVSPQRDLVSVTSGSETIERHSTRLGHADADELTPEVADARQFEERLQRSLKEGSFLVLLVNPKYYDRARSELCRRFPLQLVDFEGVFLDALQQVADKAKVKWDLVLQTDTKPQERDWDKLMMLVGRTISAVEAQMRAADKTMLVIYSGLLARYDQMDLLSRLSQNVGRSGGIPGLWLLLPGDNQAMIDGKPVPLIGPGQRARLPESWLANWHRGGQGEAGEAFSGQRSAFSQRRGERDG
ncbi:MAG: BREX system serine/threonine kinase PglW [Pirellulales bacterium]